MLVGTFPENSRIEQLIIVVEIFGIPEDNKYINIEHRNGNSWFTGYFPNKEKRTHCINKIEEINKEITNLDATAMSRTFKIHKLEEIQINKPVANKKEEISKE